MLLLFTEICTYTAQYKIQFSVPHLKSISNPYVHAQVNVIIQIKANQSIIRVKSVAMQLYKIKSMFHYKNKYIQIKTTITYIHTCIRVKYDKTPNQIINIYTESTGYTQMREQAHRSGRYHQ